MGDRLAERWKGKETDRKETDTYRQTETRQEKRDEERG